MKLECIGGTILACSYNRPELLLFIQQPREDGLQTRRVVANIVEDDPQTADEALSSIFGVILGVKQVLAKTCYKIFKHCGFILVKFCILEF